MIDSYRASPFVDLLDLRLHVGLEDGAPGGVLGGPGGAPGLLRLRGDAKGIEGQEGHHVRLAVADRDGLRDGGDLLELALEVLRRDVLAARGDEQLLLAVGHAQEAVGVDLAHVAGVDPALGVQRLAGRLLVPVVALEDVRPAHEDLPVLGDPQLGARQRVARATEAVAPRQRHRRRPRALAHAVDLHDRQGQALEVVEGFLGDRRRGDGEHPDLVEAQSLADLREDEAVREAVAPGSRPPLLVGVASLEANPPGPARDATLQRARLGALGLHAGLDLLPDPRDAQEEVRAHLAEVLGQLLEALREVDAGPGGEREQVRDDLLGDVGERQVADEAVRAAYGQDLPRLLRDEEEVALGQHHALRLAGGARGVDERGHVVRPRGGSAATDLGVVGFLPPGEEIRPADDTRARRHLVHQHDRLQPGRRLSAGLEPLERFAVLDHRHHGLRVLGDVAALLGGAVRVDPGRARPHRDRREVGDEPLRAVLGQDHDPLARLDAGRHEGTGGSTDAVAVLAPRDRLPRAFALAGHGGAVFVGTGRRFENLEDGRGHVRLRGMRNTRSGARGCQGGAPGRRRLTPRGYTGAPPPRRIPMTRRAALCLALSAGLLAILAARHLCHGSRRPRPGERRRSHRRREATACGGRGHPRQPDRRGGLDRRAAGLRGTQDARPGPPGPNGRPRLRRLARAHARDRVRAARPGPGGHAQLRRGGGARGEGPEGRSPGEWVRGRGWHEGKWTCRRRAPSAASRPTTR